MYFSKIAFHEQALQRLLRARGPDEYFFHQLIWRLFADSPTRKRDFLYHRDSHDPLPSFYVVSQRQPSPPEDLRQVLSMQTKPYEPVVQRGGVYQFHTRVNPAVRRTVKDGRSARHDIVMLRKHDSKDEGRHGAQDGTAYERVTEDCGKWLAARMEKLGFKYEQLVASSYRQHTFARGKSAIRFSSVELTGVLTVLDEVLFRETLFRGIGPAKGFGNGLLLVRPL